MGSRLHVRINGREAVFGAALPEISFGRDPSCVVRMTHEHVGPRHLLLRRRPDGWTVETADPAHPVYWQDQQIATLPLLEPLQLRLGDPRDGPVVEVETGTEDGAWLATRDTLSAAGRAAPRGRGTDADASLRFALTRPVIRIGRDPAGDVVLDDLMASRRHAELRRGPAGGYEVVDLDSHNGTFVNGRRVARAPLEQLDVVTIGRHSLRLDGDTLAEHVDTGEVDYAAVELSVRLSGGEVLLDDVSFSLESRSLLAIIGPSGSGKTTLMNALTGFRIATEGDVLYGEQSLYGNYDALRNRIGFVPQEDIVHAELPVGRALGFAAALRFPADLPSEARERRVRDVIAELGLGPRAALPVRNLSGGERKRVSVALELLTEPALLFLDEPTSGLDPGYERSVMSVLRDLSDRGHTVMVATHSVQSLRLCDRVLVLAAGGKLAYFGPPQLVAAYFERHEYADVFRDLSDQPALDWDARFRGHPYYRQYVQREGAGEPAPSATAPAHAPTVRGWWRQFSTLTQRYAAVLAADRRNLALLLAQAPVLGLLMLAALPHGELGPVPSTQLRLVSQASLVLLVVMLGVTWLGMSNSIREIVKEGAIFRRERATGLSISAYVASKAAVLGALTVVQAAVLVAIATAAQHGPRYSSLLPWPTGELIVASALAGLAAMSLGLLVSSVARTVDRATTLLPVVIVLELVLALGGVFPQVRDRPVLAQLSYAAGTRWGFAAAASTTDLNNLQSVSGVLTRARSVNVDNPGAVLARLAGGDRGDPLWDHTASAWLADCGALLGLTVLGLLGAGVALRRDDGGRRPG